MGRPVIKQIDNFDADFGTSISFVYDELASYGSLLNIYKTTDFSTIVYSNRAVNMACSNSIEANSLQNGVQYAAEIISYDQQGHASEVSNKVFFWCFASPIFRFVNVSDGEIFNNQSFTAELFYEQSDGIDISQFRYELYDSQMSLINQSEYYSNYEEHSEYNYNGLENNAIYYIRAVGQTTRSQLLDTGYISIFIQFEVPNSYSVLYANADNGNGVIEYNTNIRLIEPNRDNETYTYDYGLLDLTNDRIVYDTNFILDGDFIMAIRHKVTLGKLLTCSNSTRGFDLELINSWDFIADQPRNYYRYKLMVPNEVCNYILYSDMQRWDVAEDWIVTCWIVRINNIYDIYVFSEQDNSDQYNLFLGQLRPYNNVTKYDVWIDTDQAPTVRMSKSDMDQWMLIQGSEPVNVPINSVWIDLNLGG